MTNAKRLDRVEAQLAIADLVHGYARAIRRGQPAMVADMFVAAGTFTVCEGLPDSGDRTVKTHFASPDRLVAYLQESAGATPIPLIHNLMIEVAGDTALANSVMVGRMVGSDRQIVGEYEDAFERDHGRWRFVSRIYTIFHSPV